MACRVHALELMPEVDGWHVVGRGSLVLAPGAQGEIRVLVVQDSTGVLRAVYWDRDTRTMVAPEVEAVATDPAGQNLSWARRGPLAEFARFANGVLDAVSVRRT